MARASKRNKVWEDRYSKKEKKKEKSASYASNSRPKPSLWPPALMFFPSRRAERVSFIPGQREGGVRQGTSTSKRAYWKLQNDINTAVQKLVISTTSCFWKSLFCSSRLHLFEQKYRNNSSIENSCFLCEYLFKYNLFLWCASWIFSIITPVFSVTWSFRNHSNILLKKHFWLLSMLKISPKFLWKHDKIWF